MQNKNRLIIVGIVLVGMAVAIGLIIRLDENVNNQPLSKHVSEVGVKLAEQTAQNIKSNEKSEIFLKPNPRDAWFGLWDCVRTILFAKAVKGPNSPNLLAF